MTSSINSIQKNNPSFGACALKGDGVKDFINTRKAKEGIQAVKNFQEDLKNFVHWGYVNINKTSKPDVFELQGAGNMKTKFHANESLFDFMVKLNFLKERKAIIDQWD